MEKCARCGSDAYIRVVVEGKLIEPLEVPVCRDCYEGYRPIHGRRGLEWRERKTVERWMGPLYIVGSRRFGMFVERIGRGFLGRIASAISILGFVTIIFSIIFVVSSIVWRFMNIGNYLQSLKTYSEVNVASFMLAYLTVGGWLGLFIGSIIHELFHGLVGAYHGHPVRSVGLVLILKLIPLGAYVDLPTASPRSKDNWRITAAGISGNILLSLVILLAMLWIGVPRELLENPLRLFFPPEILRLVGLHVELSPIIQILQIILFVNVLLALGNSMPILLLDGYWVLVSMLYRLGFKRAVKISIFISITFLLSIAFSLIFETIMPYLGVVG